MSAIPSSDLPGHKHLHERVRAALDLCQETKGLEFKESGAWKALSYQIVRAVLGMSNLRDGGVLVLGVSERGDTWAVDGISISDLATYNEDEINDFINSFASPPVRVELVRVQHHKVEVLSIRVPEFENTPIICKKNGPDGSKLAEATIYVRTSGKPRTTRPVNAAELEDVLALAAEKRARKLILAAKHIGMLQPDETKQFDDELDGL